MNNKNNKNKHLIKKHPTEYVFDTANIIFLGLIALVCFYPFYYILIYSLSDPLMARMGITLYPRGFTLENFVTILQLPGLTRATFISVARTVVGSTLSVFACAFFAYIISKETLPLRKTIWIFVLATMYINAGLVPWYIVIRMIFQLHNTFWVYILPGLMSAWFVILFKVYIENLPASMEESAKIDGAGYITIFFRIIFPLCTPIVATIFVFSAVGQWNSFFDNHIFVTDERLNTLQYVLFRYLRNAENMVRMVEGMNVAAIVRAETTPMAVRMTITLLVTLPILFVYPFAQKFFVKGIMIGAIKG